MKGIALKEVLNRRYFHLSLNCLVFLLLFTACEDFVDVEVPKSQVTKVQVYSNDVTATSAVTGIYHDMLREESFASGTNHSVVSLTGLSADELVSYFKNNTTNIAFEDNNLVADNKEILNLWSSMYRAIYEANAAMEGITNSSSLTPATREQLLGETLFVRAFAHFYLVNLFGDVPLVTSTDYRLNASISRTSRENVYNQITEDLIAAKNLLKDKYPTASRVRPNKFAATALLARVYLFLGKWTEAEFQSSEIIANSATYSLPNNLNQVFLINSNEAIWQLLPVVPVFNTFEGYYFIIRTAPQYNVLNITLINDFEPGDLRRTNWVASFNTGSETVYYPFKYKISSGGPGSNPPVQLTECSMVLRLAEQFLIRAEARARQNNLSEAISDLDAIRNRAKLPLIRDTNPNISKDDLLMTIEHEKRIEFFAEWGHRWLDIKRTNRADPILSGIKTGWSMGDVLYPIPQSEINKNPKLGDQNPGY